MNDIIVKILSKYTTQPCPSEIPFDFRSNPNVFAAESQLPDLYLTSKKPRDKNLSFYKITYSTKLKENVFPHQKYSIPSVEEASIVAKKVEKVNLDDLFGGVKLTTIDVFDKDFNLENIEQSIIKNNIKKIIQENKITPYEGKAKPKAQWYLLGVRGYGPYSDEEIYNFMSKFVKDPKLQEMKDKFMIWERVGDIFYTVEVCYDLLLKTFANKPKTEVKTEITMKAPLEGKNDFENILNNLGANGEQGTIPREVNLRRYSKFNGVPMTNPQMAQIMMMNMQNMRKGNRRMTYDYSNTNMNWSYNNQNNYYNKNQYGNYQKGYTNYHHRSFANHNNNNYNGRNNYRRYTINPEMSNAINEVKEEEHKEIKNDKKEMKVIDITDTLFA